MMFAWTAYAATCRLKQRVCVWIWRCIRCVSHSIHVEQCLVSISYTWRNRDECTDISEFLQEKCCSLNFLMWFFQVSSFIISLDDILWSQASSIHRLQIISYSSIILHLHVRPLLSGSRCKAANVMINVDSLLKWWRIVCTNSSSTDQQHMSSSPLNPMLQ